MKKTKPSKGKKSKKVNTDTIGAKNHTKPAPKSKPKSEYEDELEAYNEAGDFWDQEYDEDEDD